jgi:hypothetical protein
VTLSALTTDSFVVTHSYGNLGVSARRSATVRHFDWILVSRTGEGGGGAEARPCTAGDVETGGVWSAIRPDQ